MRAGREGAPLLGAAVGVVAPDRVEPGERTGTRVSAQSATASVVATREPAMRPQRLTDSAETETCFVRPGEQNVIG